MKNNTYIIIMAGGVGSRLWPLSTKEHPKQFIDLLGTGRAFLQQTYDRFKSIVPHENIYVVTNTEYASLVEEQINVKGDQLLLEPEGRNTAPAIAYASYKILSNNNNANLVVSPADHLIYNQEGFESSIYKALSFASKSNNIVTIGIPPSRPDTGYGYIEKGNYEDSIFKVSAFKEKPNLETALSYLKDGIYVWNSGMFIWSAQTIKSAFKKYMPLLAKQFDSEVYYSDKEQTFIDKVYPKTEKESIDFGIMEKANNIFVIDAEFNWSDLGTWKSVYENSKKNKDENFIIGNNISTYEANSNIINIKGNKKVIIDGLKDYIIVDTEDSLLICPSDKEQKIKEYVNNI